MPGRKRCEEAFTMSEQPKKISVNDLPGDATAAVTEEDIQEVADAGVKGERHPSASTK